MRHLYLIAFAAAATVCGAELILPAPALERDGTVHVIFRSAPLATGHGELSIEWTDVHGRVVEQRSLAVDLNDESEIGFDIDLRRARAMQNVLRAHLVFDGQDKKGRPDHRDEQAETAFIAKPPVHTWWDYDIIMWQHYSPEQFAQLTALGINGGESSGRPGSAPPEFLLKNDLRWYAENIATDFYSAYHHYFPDRPTGYEFKLARAAHQADPASLEPFRRYPSLSDAEWLKKVHDRLVESAQEYSRYRPFFYSLGDETGIAELEAAWDFDFSDHSLTPMREWLRERYGSLSALNREWGTNFGAWNAVMPPTTDEAMKRTDDNFSAWSDFKEWMDICYARALKMGTDAVHSVDPEAYVGIGGGQMPGWGGYDYARIAQSLTAIEPYDIGNNIEIIRSLNPRMAVLTTAFAHGPWEKHRVWYELLHGNRGLILWDDKHEYIDEAGNVEERGREAETYYNEIRNGLGALLIASRRVSDPIAIHYSQPSMRVNWMLESRPRGAAWATRSPKAERTDNEFMRLRESWCRVIEDAGLQYDFVSYQQLEQDQLLRGGYRVLILPRSSALSAAEAAAIRNFAAQGGTVIADGDPGAFDEHDRRLAKPQLADVRMLQASVLPYQLDRITGKGVETRDQVAKLLRSAGVEPQFQVTGAPQGVETHVFRNGDIYLVALLSNPSLRVDELGPPDFRSNDHF
ncbi:MAG TPA: alpha-amylase family protein, partial [Bryobacteraceae bacterium]|nr:alpha-amylase family protein [Bryobacteraceae bacterium]